MKHICLTVLLLGCIALATLAIAAEPHNSHPADGDPLITLNFQTEDFAFTDVGVRELRDGPTVSWSLKGFVVRQGEKELMPFSVVVSRDEVTRANQQWNFGDERTNIIAILNDIGAVTHFDLAPIDATERTVLIENVRNGMSGQAQWSQSFNNRFPELMPGARSPGHASAFLANAFFTFIQYPEQRDRGAGAPPTFEQCLAQATTTCQQPQCDPNNPNTPSPCIKDFKWQPDGSCSFTCRSREECCTSASGG
ncbi:MAG: hypothetical protein ACNA8P_02330 [Phycisphaerales bacterium]